MIFDVRKSGFLPLVDAVRRTCTESNQAHVYVKGWVVTVLHDFQSRDSYIGSYDVRVTPDHLMSDIASEVGATIRKYPARKR